MPEHNPFKVQPGERRSRLDEALEKLAQTPIPAIDMESFRSIYGSDVVDADLAYIREREEEFSADRAGQSSESKEAEDLAKIFEAIINIYLPVWLGEKAKVVKAARFDDIRNGVDSIVEIEDSHSTNYLALAVDATFSTHTRHKIDKIKREIENGKLTMIKYFASPDGNFHGRLSRVPRVVVAADKYTVMAIVDLWLAENNEALAQHPIQHQVLDEIRFQLEAFGAYSEKIGQKQLAAIYAKQLAIFDKLLEEKKAQENKTDQDRTNNDMSYHSLKKEIAKLKT